MNKKLTVQDMQGWTYERLQNMDIKKVYPAFAWNILPFLAIQKPTKNSNGKYSATSILNALKIKDYAIKADETRDPWGNTLEVQALSGSVILSLWQFFYSTNPKEWLTKPQNKEPAIASGVPIVLYAYKHQHGIMYNEWDREDPALRLMLTENLAWLLNPPEIPEGLPDIKSLQEEFLKTGTTGIVNPPTNPKASYTSDKRFNQLPKYQRYMYLQTWLYHPSIRSDNMITDWNDWDTPAVPHGFSDLESYGLTVKANKDGLPW